MSADFNCPIEPVARAVLGEYLGAPNPHLSSKTELRWGAKGSLAVDLQKQTFFDHEDDSGGGVLDLLHAYKGFSKPEALEWLEEHGHIEKRERRANGAAGHAVAPSGQDAAPSDSRDDLASAVPDWMAEKPIAIYRYLDDRGNLAYEVLKFPKTAPRRFMQRRRHADGAWIWALRDGRYGKTKSGDWFKAKEGKHYTAEEDIAEAPRWLYRRAEILAAKARGELIVLVEGEKDVETVCAWNISSTTNSGGAKVWQASFTEDLAGADVVICHDNDAAGRQRAMLLGAELRGKAKRVRVLDLALHWKDMPEKADVTDWKEAGGDSETFRKLVAKAPEWKPERPKSRFNAFTFDQIGTGFAPQLDWLVDAWLPERGLSVVGGPSQSGKSFLAIHMAMSIARGQDFFDWPVKRGGVIYQAGEGGFGIENRFAAYKRHFGVDDDEDVPIVILPGKINLFARDGDTDALIAEIKNWAMVMSHPPAILFIDTYAMATLGANENDGKDVGFVLDHLARIEKECGIHVCIVHHMNADGRKLRGHTSLHANADTVITVICDEATKVRTARLGKQKDGEDGTTFRFSLASVKVGSHQRLQRDITSCVVLSVGEKERLKKEQERQGLTLNPTERRIMTTLFDAMDRYGHLVTGAEDGPVAAVGHIVVDWEAYKAVALERMPEVEDAQKASDQIRKEFSRAKDGLIKVGILKAQRPFTWWTGKPIRGFARTFPAGQYADKYGTNPGQTPDTADFRPSAPGLFGDDEEIVF